MTYLEQLRAYWEATNTRPTLQRPGVYDIDPFTARNVQDMLETRQLINTNPQMIAVSGSETNVFSDPVWRDRFSFCALDVLRTGWLGTLYVDGRSIPVVTDAFGPSDQRFITSPLLAQFYFVSQTVTAPSIQPTLQETCAALKNLAATMGYEFQYDAPESGGTVACILRTRRVVR